MSESKKLSCFLPGGGGDDGGVETRQGAVHQERVRGRQAARVEEDAVLVVLDDTGYHGDPEYITSDEASGRPSSPALTHLGDPRLELDGEPDLRRGRARVADTQTDEAERGRFGCGELEIAVARQNLLLGDRPRILAAVAPAGFLDGVRGRRDVDGIGPAHALQGRCARGARQCGGDRNGGRQRHLAGGGAPGAPPPPAPPPGAPSP